MKNFTKTMLVIIAIILLGILAVLFNSWRIMHNVQTQGTDSAEYKKASADLRAKGNDALLKVQQQQNQ